jgi:hypothetical protein
MAPAAAPPPPDPPPDPGERPEAGGRGARERRPFLLRVPPELMDALRAWAAQDLRSLNAHIEWLLREALKRRRGGKE